MALNVSRSAPKAVLLDIDGVLLDSGSFYRLIWETWAISRGLDKDAVVVRTSGRRTDETLRDVAPELDPNEQMEALDELVRARIGQVVPMPGAAALLQFLDDKSIPWAVVSSGSRWFARQFFGARGLPAPAVEVYGEDVREGKPSPEGYLTAAGLLKVNPDRCVVIEDSPLGVMAAKRAGATVLALSSTHPVSDLTAADICLPTLTSATRVLQDLLCGPPV